MCIMSETTYINSTKKDTMIYNKNLNQKKNIDTFTDYK